MARKSIREWKAKSFLNGFLEIPYSGKFFDAQKNPFSKLQLSPKKRYVVKVDEGIKKRMKQGLAAINQTPAGLKKHIEKWRKLGYRYFLVEEFIPHKLREEKYIAINRVRGGWEIFFSSQGGIEIESQKKSIKKFIVNAGQAGKAAKFMKIKVDIFQKILEGMKKYHLAFLEINPLLLQKGVPVFLDAACEVDTSGRFFIEGAWGEEDYTQGKMKTASQEEKNIRELDHRSQASFSFTVLHKDGAVWMLLSGGGASIVLADEVYTEGHGKALGNYGEYSGNPNAEEMYIYTKNVLSLLLQSTAKKKVLIIAGGVANFTDVRITFAGIIRALQEFQKDLQKQNVGIFVRRGGPFEKEGLASMKHFLSRAKLSGGVHGPEMVLTKIIGQALHALK